MLLALDVNSRRTGVAFGSENDRGPRCLSWTLPGGEDLPRACGSLAGSITELAKLIHPTIVVIEAPLMIVRQDFGARPALVLISLYGAAAGAAHNAAARVIDGNISTWRKHFLGRGNIPGKEAKRLATERCQQLGWAVANHDEADSAGLWAWGMAMNYKRWRPHDGSPLLARSAA